MSLEIHPNVKTIQQNQLSKSENNKLESVTVSTNNLALKILFIRCATTSTNKPSFAAGLLVSKEDLAPYFKCSEKDQFNAFLAAVAFITIWMITKSGKDSTHSQFLLDLQNTQVLGLNVEQLLEIRQTALCN